jgi:hypothetical protein
MAAAAVHRRLHTGESARRLYQLGSGSVAASRHGSVAVAASRRGSASVNIDALGLHHLD